MSIKSQTLRDIFLIFSTLIVNILTNVTSTGPLFERPFKRILIENESYLKYLVYYIHHNLVKRGFVEDMLEYTWSSFLIVSSPKSTNLKRKEVIDWFYDLENLRYFHKQKHDLDKIKDLI